MEVCDSENPPLSLETDEAMPMCVCVWGGWVCVCGVGGGVNNNDHAVNGTYNTV